MITKEVIERATAVLKCSMKYLERKSKRLAIREVEAMGLTCWDLKSKTGVVAIRNDNGPTLPYVMTSMPYRL